MLRSWNNLHLFLSFQESPLCAWTQTIYFSPFCKGCSSQPICGGSPTCGSRASGQHSPAQAAQQATKSAVHVLQKPVASDCHTGLASSHKPLLLLFEAFHPSCEGTRPTCTCPGSTILHQLSCPGASGKPSKDSLPFSLAASLITHSCPWLFFLSFSLLSQIFPSHKIQLPPYLSLIPSFQQDTHRWLSPHLRFYLTFVFSACIWQKIPLSQRGEGGMVSFHSSRAWELKSRSVCWHHVLVSALP